MKCLTESQYDCRKTVRAIKALHLIHDRRWEQVGFGQTIHSQSLFNVNLYFTVLRHLSARPGCYLDFLYDPRSPDATPEIIMRGPGLAMLNMGKQHELVELIKVYRTQQERSAIDADDWESISNYKDEIKLGTDIFLLSKILLCRYLTLDDTPESFFELSVFINMAGQFFLCGHAGYFDLEIVASKRDLDVIIKKCIFEEDPDWMAKAAKIISEPMVDMTGPDVSVTYTAFTKWGGLRRVRDSITRTSPHFLIHRIIEDELEYDCCISF